MPVWRLCCKNQKIGLLISPNGGFPPFSEATFRQKPIFATEPTFGLIAHFRTNPYGHPQPFQQIFLRNNMSILIKNFRNFLAAAAMVFSVCVVTGGVYAQQSSDNTKADKSMSADKNKPPSKSIKKDGEMIVEVPVIVMVPMQVSRDLAMDKGCWVKLYDKRNFEGNSLLLIGPINVAKMIDPFGGNWENKIYSLETGPKANVTIYNNRNFRDEDKFIDPDKKIPDMSKELGLFRNFRSIILSCI